MVIVDDMSEVNIDAALVRDDLLREVRRLSEEGRFDYLLIERIGIAERLPVATPSISATRTARACRMSPVSTPSSPWSIPQTC